MVFADVLHVALTRLTHPYPHDPLVAASPPPPPALCTTLHARSRDAPAISFP